MSPDARSPLKRYLAAIASIIAASIVTVAIDPLLGGRAPLSFFLAAVIAAAAYGGLGPGLAATVLGTVIIASFFKVQILVLSLNHAGLIVFATLGITISAILGRFKKKNSGMRRVNQRLEEANQKLEERSRALLQANEELQRFAYALAHDLNTPLRGICALTDLLVERNLDKMDESSRECAEMIVKKGQRMQAMIRGLLDYASAVEKPEGRTVVDCNAAVQRAMQDLDSAIAECNAQITVAPLPKVRATEDHLVQVFSNLINNAIKYRPKVRQPQIQISAKERGDDWVFCVSDNGIGIDMKYAEEIFGMFRRLHGEGHYEGSGIGLALCRIVIQRHGGRIWVESEIGKGCRFFFTLPKGAGASPERPGMERRGAVLAAS